MYKIRKTSFYIRKYHVQNVLSDIENKNQLPISRAIINLVCKIFDLINTVLPQVNQDRKRIISIKFVIHKLFVMWKISKSNKTIKYYEEYWNTIKLLIGDKLVIFFIILSEMVGQLSIIILSMIEYLLKKIDSLNTPLLKLFLSSDNISK